jgi:hypothetical protein
MNEKRRERHRDFIQYPDGVIVVVPGLGAIFQSDVNKLAISVEDFISNPTK